MHNGGAMDTEYKCTICYEIFLYPVRLPCKHRFCKSCLDKHIENNKMCCPICRSRVSNWLRQLRRSNGEVVDKPFWDTVQKLFPEEVDKRINGHSDYHSCLVYFRKRVAKFDGKEKSRSANLHKAFLDSRCFQEQKSDWLGWPEPVFQVCRNILRCAKDDPINKSPPSLHDAPKRSLAKPGEIHQEYEQFLIKELEEKRRQEEENLRLSEAMIRMIEEDERREEEERVRQLQKDEELARRLEEEAVTDNSGPSNEEDERLEEERVRQLEKDEELARRLEEEAATDNSGPSNELPADTSGTSNLSFPPVRSTPLLSQSSACLDTPSTSKDCIHPQSSVYHGTPTPSTSKGTPARYSQSPGRSDSLPTSKKNIFAKFFSGASSPSTKDKTLLQEIPSSGSKTSSISNKELSHFATVRPGPSDVKNGPKSKKRKQTVPSSSRCSSGCDSIGQELNHFKPIRSSPTTPPKEGSRGLIPKVVVAQRGIGVPNLSISPPLDLLGADVSLEDLETSLNLEKQIEEDKKLAMEIQNQLDEEMRNPMKGEYNLRKRKRTSDSLKKKVLLDRTQTTLDNLLIK